jgi:hypothetical protein
LHYAERIPFFTNDANLCFILRRASDRTAESVGDFRGPINSESGVAAAALPGWTWRHRVPGGVRRLWSRGLLQSQFGENWRSSAFVGQAAAAKIDN